MDKLKQAIAGQTVTVSFADLFISYDNDFTGFASEAELQIWCATFGLQYTWLTETASYQISKILTT